MLYLKKGGEKMKKQSLDCIKFAAQWWADLAFGDKESKVNIGAEDAEEKTTELMFSVLLSMAQKKQKEDPKKDDKKEIFKNTFEEIVREKIKEFGFGFDVTVDYHPDYVLHTAGQKAGINLDLASLPPKTVMIINEDSVVVKMGYGAKFEKVFEVNQQKNAIIDENIKS